MRVCVRILAAAAMVTLLAAPALPQQILLWDRDNGKTFQDPETGSYVGCEYGIQQALAANGYTCATLTNLPADISQYDIIYVVLGWCWGQGTIGQGDQQKLIDWLTGPSRARKGLYIEGNDFGYDHAPGRWNYYGLYDYFGCTWAGDGGLEPQIDRLNGQLGSWAAGWSEKYMYGSTGPDHYPDFISANGGTIVFRCQGSLGRLVTHESGGASNWWTVHSTFVFGAIIDAQSTHTKAQLMGQIIGHMTPVELASFEAIGSHDGVRLVWQTQCEEDNLGFLVHRSFHDEVQRVCISTELIPGAGTTAIPHSYSYLDPIRTPGRYSYWLEQLDVGGGTDFHGPAVAVIAPRRVALQGPYPNPASETVRLDLAIPPGRPVELGLYDARGHLVDTVVADGLREGGNVTVTWTPHAAIAPGLYRWRLTVGGYQAQKAMVIVR